MTKIWVKFNTNNSVKVSTQGCQDVDDFLEACKKKLQIPNPPQDISLTTTYGGTSLPRSLSIIQIPNQHDYVANDEQNPLFITGNNKSYKH